MVIAQKVSGGKICEEKHGFSSFSDAFEYAKKKWGKEGQAMSDKGHTLK